MRGPGNHRLPADPRAGFSLSGSRKHTACNEPNPKSARWPAAHALAGMPIDISSAASIQTGLNAIRAAARADLAGLPAAGGEAEGEEDGAQVRPVRSLMM
jgi:hypothetical protein